MRYGKLSTHEALRICIIDFEFGWEMKDLCFGSGGPPFLALCTTAAGMMCGSQLALLVSIEDSEHVFLVSCERSLDGRL